MRVSSLSTMYELLGKAAREDYMNIYKSLLHLDSLPAALLVSLQLALELLALVGQDEFVGQVVLVEVVDQVPEALLAFGPQAEIVELYLEVVLLKHAANVLKQATRALELCLFVCMAGAATICPAS